MNLEERKQISAGLSELIDRFKSLAEQPIIPPPPWPGIQKPLNKIHGFFRQVIEAFVKPCEMYLAQISADTREFEQWQFNLQDLWERLNFLRGVHNRAFCHDYTAVIYHHIFIEEMFECLPSDLPGSRSPFLLLPSGELIVWPSVDAFSALAPDWFAEEYLRVFDGFKKMDLAVFFECHREHNFERQAILAHEIFHIVTRRNISIGVCFDELSSKPEVATILGTADKEMLKSQLEELFCDFTAAWYYGPVFLQAFADEISHYPISPSTTHPPSDVRAAFLLATNSKSYHSHRGYKVLEQYLNLRRRHHVALPEDAKLMPIGSAFEKTLGILKLSPYKHIDLTSEIERSFDKNIPFVTKDIRLFINNLPVRKRESDLKRYSDLVSESLRKTNILRQIMAYVRDSDKLFAIPPALAAGVAEGSAK
jgi:hypothetical protein